MADCTVNATDLPPQGCGAGDALTIKGGVVGRTPIDDIGITTHRTAAVNVALAEASQIVEVLAPITVTLPTTSMCLQIILVNRYDQDVTINTADGSTINGDATMTMCFENTTPHLYKTSTGWFKA